MFSIAKNNSITITRGDSASTSIFINRGDLLEVEQYQFQPEDVVYVGVMEYGQRFEDAIIKYKLTAEDLDADGCPILHFSSTDTEYLEPGTYFYEVKLSRDNGAWVDTVVSKTPIYIQD